MNLDINFFLVLLFTIAFTLLINKGIEPKKYYIEHIWTSPMATIVYSPVWEEIVFRGLPILFFGNNIFSWAMIISNSIFTLIHLQNVKKGKILLVIDVFVFASIMAWVSVTYGILYAILIHITINSIGYIMLCLYLNKRERINFSLNTNNSYL